MRAVKAIVLIWLVCGLAMWIRGGNSFCILDALPFAKRQEDLSPHYEWLALAAVLIGIWGCLTLAQRQPPAPAVTPSTAGPTFRAGLLLVPAAIIIFALLSRRLSLRVRFEDLFSLWELTLEHRYLAVLCLGVFATVLIYRRYRGF